MRFFEVRNVKRLESELDQIYVGNKKLFVNVPKYHRNQLEPKRYERRNLRNQASGIKRDNREVNQKEHGLFGKKNRKEVWVEKKG